MAGAVKLTGDWEKLEKILATLPKRLPAALAVAVNAEAQKLRGHIIKNITSGGAHAGKPFAPLSPMTLIIRRFTGFGGSKPLMVSGSMRNSVSVIRTGKAGAFVGILRGAPHKSGKGAVNIARIHEEGRTFSIPKTRKMIRFLAAALKSAGQKMGSGPKVTAPGTILVSIPARPFMQPVFDKYADPNEVADRVWSDVARQLGGDLGKPG